MRDGDGGAIAALLLPWYDRHARDLPWRIPPGSGQRPDPYRVWLSEVMLQQTTVAAVAGYFRRFTDRWPTVAALAAAPEAEVMAAWAGLGYYARARNLIACARAVAAAGGFPDTEEELRALPGIGRYTAAAVAAIAFGRVAVVVDGNVERVMARLHAIETPLPGAKAELTALAAAHTPAARPGDYAQAVMDLGATICTPRRPACGICPLRGACAAEAAGIAEGLPRKAPEALRPLRRGIAYVARDAAGAVLLERRPDSGLLGGMLGWPTTDWTAAPTEAPPLPAVWTDPGAEVRHIFTHFELRLAVRVARVEAGAEAARGEWVPAPAFRPASLPTVMRKAWDIARPALG
jgi:A/G-specific adenine glycosylase